MAVQSRTRRSIHRFQRQRCLDKETLWAANICNSKSGHWMWM